MEEYEYQYQSEPKPVRRSPFADSPYECVCPVEQTGAPVAANTYVPQSTNAPKHKWGRKILSCIALSLADFI